MSKKSSVVLSVAAAVLATTAIFLGVPAIIYGGNDGEFLWPFNNILATYWPWATGLAALLVAPALALPAKWARRWAAAATVLATYAWAHGVFQTHKFGDIDGRDWSAAVPAWQSVVEAVVLLAAIVAVWVLAHRAQRPAAGLQLFLAAGLVLQAWPAISESEWRAISDETRMTEAATFSTEANALIVLMDTMASDVFEEVVTETPALREAFDGFMLYPDTVGAAPTTYLSMPTIHSGRTYEDGAALGVFFDDEIGNRSVLTKVANAGYRGILVNPIRVCPKDLTCFNTRQAMTGNQSSVRADGAAILDAVLFRLAPLALKSAVYNEGEWVVQKWTQDARFVHRIVEGNYFLREMAEAVSLSADKPTLKFIHLYTTHPPFVYKKECRYAGRERKSSRENFALQVKCSLESFATLLQALKDQGIYDRTAMLLIADHGIGYVSNRWMPSNDKSWGKRAGSANPTFAVKPLGARGAFRTVEGEIHIGDFGATLCDLLKVCQADAGISALQQPSGRVRIFNDYRWKAEYWHADTIKGLSKYEVRGPIGDPASWTKMAPVEGTTTVEGGHLSEPGQQ